MKTSKNLWVVVQSGTKMFNKKFFMPLQALPTRKKARQWMKKNTINGNSEYTKISVVKFVRS